MSHYHLFGLGVASDFPLPILNQIKIEASEVQIRKGELASGQAMQCSSDAFAIHVPNTAYFRITGGDTITV